MVQELLQTILPQFEKDLQEMQKDLQAMPVPPMPAQSGGPTPAQAIVAGERKFTDIRAPALAIFAIPHASGPVGNNDPVARAASEARDLARTGAQVKAFENGVPSARVVRLPNANHYVFLSNEADVLREMNAFLGSLP